MFDAQFCKINYGFIDLEQLRLERLDLAGKM
jgi:hypothetical protein